MFYRETTQTIKVSILEHHTFEKKKTDDFSILVKGDGNARHGIFSNIP
jgi:hypothetical protein